MVLTVICGACSDLLLYSAVFVVAVICFTDCDSLLGIVIAVISCGFSGSLWVLGFIFLVIACDWLWFSWTACSIWWLTIAVESLCSLLYSY